MSDVRLRHALRIDLDAIAELWVDAFAGDPYLRWVQPDDAGWPAFGRAWMDFILGLTFERGHVYVADPPDVATAWVAPDLALIGADDVERGHAILAEHGGPAKADDALATIMAARGHALEESHWTLQYIGVRPSAQSSGLGGAAISPMLGTCDEDGLACGLISTNPRNVPFYERHGFAVDAEVPTPDGAAAMRPMHREPRA